MDTQVVEVSYFGTKQFRTLNEDNVDIFRSTQSVIEYINDQVDNGNKEFDKRILDLLTGLYDIQIGVTQILI